MEAKVIDAAWEAGPSRPLAIRIHLCVPDHEEHLLPKRRRAPILVPHAAPLPRVGEVVYLSSSSAWSVTMVVHSWQSARDLRVEIWLEHVGEGEHPRLPGFARTQ